MELAKAANVAQIVSVLPAAYCAYATWATLHPPVPPQPQGSATTPGTPMIWAAFGAFVALLVAGFILRILSSRVTGKATGEEGGRLKIHSASIDTSDVQEKRKQLNAIKAEWDAEKSEVKQELWSLIAEYIQILSRWPNEIPAREPFTLTWRPDIGETHYGRDKEAVMEWVRKMERWTSKAESRLKGIEDLELINALKNHTALGRSGLGAIPSLLSAMIHVDARVSSGEAL